MKQSHLLAYMFAALARYRRHSIS